MPLLLKKINFRLRIILPAAVLFFLVSPSHAQQAEPEDSFTTQSGTIIMFQKFDRKYYETLQYLKYADRQISALVNSSAVKKELNCKLLIVNEEVKGGINLVRIDDTVNIYLNRDFRNDKNKFTIIIAMIRAMMLAKTGFDPTSEKLAVPRWLLVGLYGRLNLRFFSHSILPIAYYPGLKALCQAEKLPDFRIAVFTALDPDKDGTGYLLYEELCRFLLLEIKNLSSRADNSIVDAIFLSAREKYSPDEIFDYTIARAITKDYDKARKKKNRKYDPNTVAVADKLQQWFKNTAEKRLINPTSPLQTDYFVKRFYKFRRFTYIHKDKDRAATITKDISNITAIYDQYGPGLEFDQMLDKKIQELNLLIFVSQPLCFEQLIKLRDILRNFESMPSTLIRKRLVRVLSQLEQTLERQKKIEDYLRKIEYSNVSYGKLYRNELIENKRLKDKFCPAISNYLDEVEKSFLKD